MILPQVDEMLCELGGVNADHAPFAVATIVVTMLAALVFGAGLPVVRG